MKVRFSEFLSEVRVRPTMSGRREPVPSTSAFNLASEAACYDSTFDTDDEDTRYSKYT